MALYKVRCSYLALLALSSYLTTCNAVSQFRFFTALVIGKQGDCAGVATIDNGIRMYIALAENTTKHLVIKDGSGSQYTFSYQYRWVDDGCNRTRHSQLLQQEAAAGTHFFYGSGPTFAQDESALSAQLTGATYPANTTRGRMMYQCCLGPDPIYEQNIPTVFGIQTSNKKYTAQLLKAMALQGVKRVVVAYRTDNLFTSTTCEAGLAMLPGLQKLNPTFQIVDTIRYNASSTSPFPGFLSTIVPRVIAAGADAFVGCDLKPQGAYLTDEFAKSKYYLKALFITVTPSYNEFFETHGAGANYVTTPVQWHPAMTYADGFFGSSEEYTKGFAAMFPGLEADYVSAGASAVGYTLSIAISTAFQRCDISRALAKADESVRTDALLFDADAINCTNVLGQVLVGKTGYQLILESLAAYQGDTFFGPVEFNRFRRNVAKVAAVTQWLDGQLECVLPLDAANKGLVLPIPPPKPPPERLITRVKLAPGVVAAIVVSAACVLVLCLAVFVLWQHQRRQHKGLFGGVKAPGPGSLTTLLVSDVEGSTQLWESLPAAVMEKSMLVHHATLRRGLAAHAGYESGTQGDSFILAFHTPAQALAYAVSVQAQLLIQDWPAELLEHEKGQPIWVCSADCSAVPSYPGPYGEGPLSNWAGGYFFQQLIGLCKQRADGATAGRSKQYWQRTASQGASRAKHSASIAEGPEIAGPFEAAASTAGVAQLRSRLSAASLTLQSFGSQLFAFGGGHETRVGLSRARSHKGHANWQQALRVLQEEVVVEAQATTADKEREAAEAADETTIYVSVELQAVLSQLIIPADADMTHKVLVFRGLRVRMGLHAGVGSESEASTDVKVNQATGRVMFGGVALTTATHVSDAAAGGQVLLDADVLRQLTPADLDACKALLMHMGEHRMAAGKDSETLYQVLGQSLLPRLPLFAPLRGTTPVSHGMLQSPVGFAAVSFLQVTGAQTLLAWNASIAQDALQELHAILAGHVLKAGGYLAEVSDGFVLSLYHDPGAALLGLLQCQAALTAHDWDPQLLRHELCEEIAVMLPVATPSFSHQSYNQMCWQSVGEPEGSGVLPRTSASHHYHGQLRQSTPGLHSVHSDSVLHRGMQAITNSSGCGAGLGSVCKAHGRMVDRVLEHSGQTTDPWVICGPAHRTSPRACIVAAKAVPVSVQQHAGLGHLPPAMLTASGTAVNARGSAHLLMPATDSIQDASMLPQDALLASKRAQQAEISQSGHLGHPSADEANPQNKTGGSSRRDGMEPGSFGFPPPHAGSGAGHARTGPGPIAEAVLGDGDSDPAALDGEHGECAPHRDWTCPASAELMEVVTVDMDHMAGAAVDAAALADTLGEDSMPLTFVIPPINSNSTPTAQSAIPSTMQHPSKPAAPAAIQTGSPPHTACVQGKHGSPTTASRASMGDVPNRCALPSPPPPPVQAALVLGSDSHVSPSYRSRAPVGLSIGGAGLNFGRVSGHSAMSRLALASDMHAPISPRSAGCTALVHSSSSQQIPSPGMGMNPLGQPQQIYTCSHSVLHAGHPLVPATRRKVLMRGLRVKASLDVGPLMDSVRPTNGRMEYRGRAMNRAARIAALASSNQVLVSGQAWHLIQSRFPRDICQVCMVDLGRMQLKGIPQPVQVFKAELREFDEDVSVRLDAAPCLQPRGPHASHLRQRALRSQPAASRTGSLDSLAATD